MVKTESKKPKFSPPRVDILIAGVGGGGGSIVKEMAQKMDGRKMPGFVPDFLVVDSDFRTFHDLPRCVGKFELKGKPLPVRQAGLASQGRIPRRLGGGQPRLGGSNLGRDRVENAPPLASQGGKENPRPSYALRASAGKQDAVEDPRQGLPRRQAGGVEGKGTGTGMDPALGQAMAEAAQQRFLEKCSQYNVVVLIGCLGGGVGSGALPVFAESLVSSKNPLSSSQRSGFSVQRLTLGILALPFEFEGAQKMKIAEQALKKLRPKLSGYVVVANDRIFGLCEKATPLNKALSLLNQTLVDYLADLIEVLSKPGLINIDFADLRTILQGKGRQLYFGRGEARGEGRLEKVIGQVFASPLFRMPATIKRLLFNVSGGSDLTLQDVEKVSAKIAELNHRAKIIFGISAHGREKGKLKVVLLAVGGKIKKKKKIKKIKKIEKSPEKTPKSPLASSKNPLTASKSSRSPKPAKPVKPSKPSNLPLISPNPPLTPSNVEPEPGPVRRNGLDVQREKQKAQDERRAKETEWEIPAFMK